MSVIKIPAKRGRKPNNPLTLRPRKIVMPFAASAGTPNPERQRALKFFLQWMGTAETCTRPDDRRQAAEEALNALAQAGLTVQDLLAATPEATK